jgi:hypothetical protein
MLVVPVLLAGVLLVITLHTQPTHQVFTLGTMKDIHIQVVSISILIPMLLH